MTIEVQSFMRGRSQIAILLEQRSVNKKNIDHAILALGDAYKVLPNLWLLNTEKSANGVRNQLIQDIGQNDVLLVIDASRGMASWFNFGPEAEGVVRRLWGKAS